MEKLLVLSTLLAVSIGHPTARNNTGCGVQSIQPHTPPAKGISTYIIGGKIAVPHSWPWMALLRFRDQPLNCGGSLIRSSSGQLVVLTAAQCVDGTLPSDWAVDVGVHSRSASEPNQATYMVSKIIVHEQWDPRYAENDIAILEFSRPVTENEAVSPICVTTLPTTDFFGKQCVITGWGVTSTVSGGIADQLKEVYKPVLTYAQCLSTIGGAFHNQTMMCAGYLEGGKGACSKDVGGPLACKNANGQYDLIGMVSWSFGCALEGLPAVYTNVHRYRDWIINKTSTN